MRNWLLILLFHFLPLIAFSQCPNPINVNLATSPTAVFSNSYATVGPLTVSNTCCPAYAMAGERCIKFSITLHPDAKGVRLEMNPAVNQGVFRVGCSSTTYNVGSVVCLQGAGPHTITFCNASQVTSIFKITSIPKATAGQDISIAQDCSKIINATGFDSTAVSWTSVPNNPTYNNYLSCTSCLKPTVTAGASPPPYVDYKICGNSACGQTCDTVRVFFTPPLSVSINPSNPTICSAQSLNSTSISATGTGGSGTYSFLWNNINTSQTITVPAGFYTVVMSDGTGCSASAMVEVKKFNVPISVDAGPPKTVCKQSPTTMLAGVIAGAGGGIWSGGGGTFSPNNTALNATYTPTSAELASGSVTLTLTSTGNGTCTAMSDVVTLTYDVFTGTIATTPTPADCYGTATGSATASVSGGASPHTYLWNTTPVQTNATATNLAIGSYTVAVTDAIGCVNNASVVITQPTPIAIASSIIPVTCAGGSNGEISLTTTGGTSPYTYQWQPGGETTSSINAKPAGTYTVTVTDSKGCTQQANYTITEPDGINITYIPTPPDCYNGTNGKATTTISGGTAPYTYNWNIGSTAPDATGLAAGNYTLTVTDNLQCSVSETITITQPTAFTATTTTTSETCNYLNDGSATVTATGGTPSYTYQWQPGGATTATITNIASGTYTITATDSKGCTTTGFATVTEPAALTANFISQLNVSCYAGNDGQVTVSPSGGTFPYTYSWTPSGTTSATINNLSTGTYTVTVTDSKNCTATNSITITQPDAPLSISTSTVIDVGCNGGNDGSVSVTPEGGTAPYTYLWQPGNQTSATASNLVAGTYTLTLKDAKNCQITSTYTVNEPAPITANLTNTPISCIDGNDGSINTSITGGNLPYTYLWSPGGETTSTISNLTSGSYTVTITDNKGCTTSGNTTLINPTPVVHNPVITNVVCSGGNSGAIELYPTGGTAPYTYQWSLGGQTTSLINSLSIGTYTATVTDAKGCSVTANYTITQLSLTIALTPIHVSCFGSSDGSISAVPSGGTPNFNYLWSPGGATTNAITDLSAGTYTLSITDSKGCVAENSITITQPDAVSVTTTSTDKTCAATNNGTATAIPSGGTPSYTYIWQPGLQTTATISNLGAGNYTVTVADSNGCTGTGTTIVGQPLPLIANFTGQSNVSTCYGGNNGSVTAAPTGGTAPYTYLWMPGSATTATISNLTAGTYTLSVTDSNACTASNIVTITQPTPLTATVAKTNETCNYSNDGTATVTPLGGTPPYTYLWQPASETTATISGLSAGNYTVTVTDANGCNITKTTTIGEPATLTVNFNNITNVSCNGGNNGKANSVIAGGNPNYSYLWTPGAITTANRNNLTAGTHTLTVTDAKGCTASNTVTLTEPTLLSGTVISTNETCSYSNNGTATVTPSGGTPGYTYLWQPGLQTTATRTGMSANTYTVTIKDSKACATNITVVIAEPPPLAINFTGKQNVSCNGGNNGVVTASPTGGTPGYTYLWSPGGATTATNSNLAAGTYSVTVTDSAGCSLTKTVTITQPNILLASVSRTNETCEYLNNGTATINPSGGTPNYTYLWQPSGQTTKAATNLSAGTYTVVATDNNGCTITKIVNVVEPDTLKVTFNNKNDVACYGESTGSIATTISGGTPNYSYSWMPGNGTNAVMYNLAANTYTVTITDYQGCIAKDSITITQPPPYSVSASATPATCSNADNGTLSSAATGGTSPYTYQWFPYNYTTANVSSVKVGTYVITVTDSMGCTTTNTASVTQPNSISFSISTTNSQCNAATGSAIVTPSGGFAPYTYLWTPIGGTDSIANNLPAGHYTIEVTDANGCTYTDYADVNNDSVPILTLTSENVKCIGDSTGWATVHATGGVGTYSYLWSPSGSTDTTATNLPIGIHTVEVTTFPNGCKAYASTDIDEPTQISISATKTNVSCNGGSNGTASVVAFGGTPGYTYMWMPGAYTNDSINNLLPGTYTITVTDSNSCTSQTSAATVSITEPTVPISVSTSSTPATCFGGSTGTITATTATGGAGEPYSYQWMPGNLNGQNIIRLPANTYTLTVTDGKGCPKIDSVTVTQPTLINIAFSNQKNVSCYEGSNGTVTANVSGGTPNYTYLWLPTGATTPTINNLPAGKDSLIVTDNNGCIRSSSITITQPPAFNVSLTKTNETCDYLNNGTAQVSATGGTPPYAYSWLPGGATTDSIFNLSSGLYTVTVRDSLGCVEKESIDVKEPAFLGISFTNLVPVSCMGGSDAIVTGSPSGGTKPYTYSWAPNLETTPTLNNLAIGTYTLTVTDSNNCLAQTPVTITQPNSMVSGILSSTPTSCYNGNDGSVSVKANGGTPPYNYEWLPGYFNGDSISNLSIGSYTVTITDDNGCTFTDSVIITQPTDVDITKTALNANCGRNDGQASVAATGGIPSYSYEWQPGGYTTPSVTNLGIGSYTVTVTDNNACIKETEIIIGDTPAPSAIISTTNVSCLGANDGTATAYVTSPSSPFTYSWQPGGSTDSIINNLTIGYYTLTVTDVNLCQSLPATSPEITQPPAILILLTQTPVSCFGGSNGSITSLVAGGTAPYSYLWTPGGSTSPNINNLPTGSYTLQVTDFNGCVQSVSITVKQPLAPLSSVISATPATCYGKPDGKVSASINGGTAPYNYFWMPGNINGQNLSNLAAGSYTLTVVDAKGCSITDSATVTEPTALALTSSNVNSNCSMPNGQASVTVSGGTTPYSYSWTPTGGNAALATGLMFGSYTVTVTDSNACVSTTAITVNDNPAPLASVSSVTSVSCYGGNDGGATATVTGNAAPYTYSWLPSTATGATATGLTAGTYTLIVTDSNMCQSLPAISPAITQPQPIIINVTNGSVSCFGESDVTASATVSGGTPGYSYLWLPSSNTGTNINNLSVGTYTLQITDNNSCIDSSVFIVAEPIQLAATISSVTNVNCFGESTGSATVTANGGTPVYSYSWMPSGGNSPTQQALAAGSYTVTVTDFNGCTAVDSVTITQPAQPLTATAITVPVSCFGAADGKAGIHPIGGTPNYSYQWNPAVSTNDTAYNLPQNNYTVIVTDNNGCETNVAITINEAQPFTGNLAVTNPSCEQQNGAIITQLSGGASPYTYLWSTSDITASINNLDTGSYSVQIQDFNGCNLSLSTPLTIAPSPGAVITSTDSVSCFAGNDGQATVTINNGVPPFSITWLPTGGNAPTATGLTAGTYTVNVTDALGCISSDTTTVYEPTMMNIAVTSFTNVLCNGQSTGTASATASGGTPGYTYNWLPSGANLATANNLVAGTHTLTVTDNNNCPTSISVTLTEPDTLELSIDTLTHPVCYGGSGQAAVLPTGGVQPYSYLWSNTADTSNVVNNIVAGTYTVTVTDANSCNATVIVNITQPTQIITTAGTNDTLCLGQSGSVSATATGGAGNYFYAWQPSSAITGGTLNITPTADVTYTVVAYDQLGCSGTADNVSAILYTLNNLNVQAHATSPICPGQPALVYVETTGYTGELTYQWNNGLGASPGIHTVTPAAPTQYIVTVNNVCASVSDTVDITFNPPPVVIFTSDTNALCVPGSIQFTDNSITGNPNDPITIWNWNFGDGSSSAEQNPSHSYTAAMNYPVTLTVTTSGGCTNTSSTPLTINGYPYPVAAFSVNSTDLILPYESLICNNQSTLANSYLWNFGDGSTSTETNPQYLYSTIGQYQVQLIATSQNGCNDTATTEITTNADIVFPTAFTPNLHGSNGGEYDINSLDNNVFFPYTSGVVSYNMDIYNRWGEVIFSTDNIKQGWDGYFNGKLCQQDVYIWKVFIELNNGKKFDISGNITLLH